MGRNSICRVLGRRGSGLSLRVSCRQIGLGLGAWRASRALLGLDPSASLGAGSRGRPSPHGLSFPHALLWHPAAETSLMRGGGGLPALLRDHDGRSRSGGGVLGGNRLTVFW